jgi:hypothetical protein
MFLVANQNWLLHQLDVKNVFLNGDLKEVFIEILSGLEKSFNYNKVVEKITI